MVSGSYLPHLSGKTEELGEGLHVRGAVMPHAHEEQARFLVLKAAAAQKKKRKKKTTTTKGKKRKQKQDSSERVDYSLPPGIVYDILHC